MCPCGRSGRRKSGLRHVTEGGGVPFSGAELVPNTDADSTGHPPRPGIPPPEVPAVGLSPFKPNAAGHSPKPCPGSRITPGPYHPSHHHASSVSIRPDAELRGPPPAEPAGTHTP